MVIIITTTVIHSANSERSASHMSFQLLFMQYQIKPLETKELMPMF
jgi:hypothetical protein